MSLLLHLHLCLITVQHLEWLPTHPPFLLMATNSLLLTTVKKSKEEDLGVIIAESRVTREKLVGRFMENQQIGSHVNHLRKKDEVIMWLPMNNRHKLKLALLTRSKWRCFRNYYLLLCQYSHKLAHLPIRSLVPEPWLTKVIL